MAEGKVVMGGGVRGLLVGFDGSWPSLDAVRWAAAEADARGTPLTVCYVTDDRVRAPIAVPLHGKPATEVEGQAQKLVDSAVAAVHRTAPNVAVTAVVRHGAPVRELVRLAAEAELVVVGHRGFGGFAELLLGSVGRQVAAHVAAPAVIVRPATKPDGPVLIGLDGAVDRHPALEFGFEYAARHGCDVQVLHAFRDPIATAAMAYQLPEADCGHARQAAARGLTDAVRPWQAKYPQVQVELLTLGTPATHALVDASLGSCLLVVGRRRPGGLTGLLLGSVSQTVLRHAHCPVAVVG
jgi:nucleotide-binding universal stress UspA family protein